MSPEQIAQLLRPFVEASPGPTALPPVVLTGVQRHLELLVQWNARISLTSVRSEQEMVQRHFGEAIFAARTLQIPSAAGHLADLGSGAGFPGLPIALYAACVPEPAASGETTASDTFEATLIESSQKKAVFLREVVRSLKLTNVRVAAVRGEEHAAAGGTAAYDVVTMRAVDRFAAALPIAELLCRAGGRLALLIGVSQVPEAAKAVPLVVWDPVIPVPGSRERILLIGRLPVAPFTVASAG